MTSRIAFRGKRSPKNNVSPHARLMAPDLSDALTSLGRHEGRTNTGSQGHDIHLLQAGPYDIDDSNLHVMIDRNLESGTKDNNKTCGDVTAQWHIQKCNCTFCSATMPPSRLY